MKQPVYIFNPDSDMALANGNGSYLPPARVRKMEQDLALLPAWYAPQGSSIWLPFEADRKSIYRFYESFFPEVELIKSADIKPDMEVCPWGWSPRLVKQLCRLGMDKATYPDKKSMEELRRLSHRSFSADLLQKLLPLGEYCGSACSLTSEEEVRLFAETHLPCVLKAPWSGSGKGLFWCRNDYSYQAAHWSRHVLQSQHAVIGETVYNKAADFAMEFFSDGCGKVSFSGFSVFCTDGRGAYRENRLASDRTLLDSLSTYLPSENFQILKRHLETLLSVSLGAFYRGYLGVDMMIVRSSGVPDYRIHPCVEVNLRMNMGMVSRLFFDRYVHPAASGTFSVGFFPDSQELREQDARLRKKYPLRIEGNKIRSGYLPLTPIELYTHYYARILVS